MEIVTLGKHNINNCIISILYYYSNVNTLNLINKNWYEILDQFVLLKKKKKVFVGNFHLFVQCYIYIMINKIMYDNMIIRKTIYSLKW